jgi:hypothetical protein
VSIQGIVFLPVNSWSMAASVVVRANGASSPSFCLKLVKLILLDKSNGIYLVEVLDCWEEATLTTGKVEGPKIIHLILILCRIKRCKG